MYTYRAKIIGVYDADTVTAVVDLGFKMKFEMKLRLLGINAPEMRGEEREQGIISRDKLRELVLNKVVTLKTEKDRKGKYGRYLATLFIDDTNINELLVKEGYAKRYAL